MDPRRAVVRAPREIGRWRRRGGMAASTQRTVPEFEAACDGGRLPADAPAGARGRLREPSFMRIAHA